MVYNNAVAVIAVVARIGYRTVGGRVNRGALVRGEIHTLVRPAVAVVGAYGEASSFKGADKARASFLGALSLARGGFCRADGRNLCHGLLYNLARKLGAGDFLAVYRFNTFGFAGNSVLS